MPYLGSTPARGLVGTANIDDDAVTLDKIASGTDGELITWDASGNPAAVGAGTSGHFLKSQGAGSVPVFAASGTSLAIYTDQESAGSSAGDNHATGAWRTITLNTEVLDADGIGALSSNAITLGAGTYRIECYAQADADAATFSTNFSRIRDTTNSTTLVVGPRGVATGDSGVTPSSSKIAYIKGQFTLSGTAAFEYQVYPVGATFDLAGETTDTGEVNIAAVVYVEKI